MSLLAAVGSWSCAHSHTQRIVPIAEARQMPLGSVVAVGGSVTVPAGVFQSATSDEGFAVQDQTAGIYVSLPVDTGADIGRAVGVTGQLAEQHGLLTIRTLDAGAVVRFSAAAPVPSEPVKTGTVGANTGGRLVRISGTIKEPVHDDLPYGYRIVVDDGSGPLLVFVHASTGIDVSRLHAGQRVDITGFSGQYGSKYELWPRSSTDIGTSKERLHQQGKVRRRP